MISDENDNNNSRISIRNIGGRITTFDDFINIRKRIIKIIKAGKLPKEINLTAFYVSDKNKIIIENKLKKMRERIQFLIIIN
jgi:hypothetical protein